MNKIAYENELLAEIATSLPEARRVLVFAPHPDDEIFGCGGALSLLRQSGADISVHILTDGALGGVGEATTLTKVRADESRSAAALLGLSPPHFWGLPDRGLHYGETLILRLIERIKLTDADLVFLPAVSEIHPDHQALSLCGIEALRRLGGKRRVAFYEINAPLAVINLLVDITEIEDQKLQAMNCFTSQLAEQPYASRVRGLNCFRAYSLGCNAVVAEAFLMVSVEKLDHNLQHIFDGPSIHRRRLNYVSTPADLPLVSIIVRSMDRPTLTETLDSIALQTYPNIEVVLVNAKGGKFAEPSDLCGTFPLRIINDDAFPLSRSRAANVGLDASRGHYIGFLDDDDIYDADHVSNLVDQLLKSPDCQVAYAAVRMLNRGDYTSCPIRIFSSPHASFSRLLLGNLIPIHAVLFAAEQLQKGIRFDENLNLYEDWDFWLQLAKETDFVFVDRVTATYFTEGGSSVGAGLNVDISLQKKSERILLQKWLGLLTVENIQSVSDLFHHCLAEQKVVEEKVSQAEQALKSSSHDDIMEMERIIELEKTVRAIYSSRSWMITRPLRWVRYQIIKLIGADRNNW